MPTFQASGRRGLTKVFTASVSPGTTLTFPVPVKTFIIRPVGGPIQFKFNSTDADADAFPINDGEAMQFDLSLAYPIVSNVATIGVIIGNSISTYVAIGY